MPEFLPGIRARAESFAQLAPGKLQHVLITEYCPGAAISWHKDRSVFGDVVGISLLSACTFRLRLKAGHDDPVADLEVGDLGPELDHLAHVFMTKDVVAFHGRLVAVERVEVGTTDGAGRDLDDRIAGMPDLRIRNSVHPNVAFSVPT